MRARGPMKTVSEQAPERLPVTDGFRSAGTGSAIMQASLDRLRDGTYQFEGVHECASGVARAIQTGYQHIDTAQMYYDESDVAACVQRSDCQPDELFIARKLWTDNLRYEDVIRTATQSRDRLGDEMNDLPYVHWPIRTSDSTETLPALDTVVDEGVIDHVWLSNFRPDQLDRTREVLDAEIFVHQVQCHPLFQQETRRDCTREDDHWLVAYSPITRSAVAEIPLPHDIAATHEATLARVSLAWLLSEKMVVTVLQTVSHDHVVQNWAARNLELSSAEIDRIDALEGDTHVVDFDVAPWDTIEG